MWTRAALAYPASFWMMAVSGFVLGLLDFVGIWIMFHTIDTLGGFDLVGDRVPVRRHRLRPRASPTWSSAGSSGWAS